MTGAELPIGERKARAVEEMFDRIAPRYELVNRVMTLGLDAGWRRRAVRELHLDPGARVVDLGCGTGDLCRVLGRAGLRAVGVDMAAEMLARAHTSAPLVRADALQLPSPTHPSTARSAASRCATWSTSPRASARRRG